MAHRKQKAELNNRPGFTLIELLIVIAIIGILTAVVLVSLADSRTKSNIAVYKTQAQNYQKVLYLLCQDQSLSSTLLNANMPPSNNKIQPMQNGNINRNNCGLGSAGEFEVVGNAIDLGSSTQASACEFANDTVYTADGVTFRPGC